MKKKLEYSKGEKSTELDEKGKYYNCKDLKSFQQLPDSQKIKVLSCSSL